MESRRPVVRPQQGGEEGGENIPFANMRVENTKIQPPAPGAYLCWVPAGRSRSVSGRRRFPAL